MATNPEMALIDSEDKKPRFDPWKMRLWRKAKGMTAQQLSNAAGYGHAGLKSISQIERYVLKAGAVTLRRLSDALDVKDTDLLSTGGEWRANRAKYDAWVADGRPNLAAWLTAKSNAADDLLRAVDGINAPKIHPSMDPEFRK